MSESTEGNATSLACWPGGPLDEDCVSCLEGLCRNRNGEAFDRMIDVGIEAFGDISTLVGALHASRYIPSRECFRDFTGPTPLDAEEFRAKLLWMSAELLVRWPSPSLDTSNGEAAQFMSEEYEAALDDVRKTIAMPGYDRLAPRAVPHPQPGKGACEDGEAITRRILELRADRAAALGRSDE